MEAPEKTEERDLDSMRVATANVLKEINWGEGGVEIKNGTKHFRGGAKVYIIDYYPGMCESVVGDQAIDTPHFYGCPIHMPKPKTTSPLALVLPVL